MPSLNELKLLGEEEHEENKGTEQLHLGPVARTTGRRSWQRQKV